MGTIGIVIKYSYLIKYLVDLFSMLFGKNNSFA